MTEENLKSFISCPYKFYYETVEKKRRPLDWRQMVQHVVNQVVYSYFKQPAEQRHPMAVLKLVEQYWTKVPLGLFESRTHYYMVVAKITDYLMQYLNREVNTQPPLFLFEKFKTQIEELNIELSLTFDVGEWSSSSFIVKKYLVEASAEMLHLYQLLIVVFSDQVFKKIPEKIEVVTLLDGKKHVFYPSEEKVSEGLYYLQVIKQMMEESTGFQKWSNEEECRSCPFQTACERVEEKFVEKSYFS
ncbi:hypothetical protein BTR25_11370 [Bacillus sp. MRMR6]|nr:hypothetical protein BTR25_11370 [Bacillus sp. MRMR6]